jgi:hypothetical protein
LKVLQNGQDVIDAALGYANEENQVQMKMDNVFPIGSNTKLFTAVALYQLQEQGKVDLSQPVNKDLTQQDFADFGLPNQSTWCPKLQESDECQEITYQNLVQVLVTLSTVIMSKVNTAMVKNTLVYTRDLLEHMLVSSLMIHWSSNLVETTHIQIQTSNWLRI